MDDSPTKNRQAGVEVTPEMIEAGVNELLSHDSEDLAHTNPHHTVRWIFEAMAQTAPRGHVSID